MFDLRQLRYFVVVAEQEHVGRAAKILNITQSPLSRQIIELETKLGIQLFRRSNKRLFLTQTGRNFLGDARALLAHRDKIERGLKHTANGEAGTLMVGYVDGILHSGILSKALKTLKTKIPKIDVKLKALRSGDQFQELLSGELDIGITYSEPMNMPEISSELIYSEPFKLAVSSDRGWTGRARENDLDGMPFIWHQAPNHPATDQTLLQHCIDAGFHPDVRYEVASPLAALDLVEAGLGFALIQTSLERAKPKGVDFIAMPPGFRDMISIHLVNRVEKTRLEKIFIKQLRQFTTTL